MRELNNFERRTALLTLLKQKNIRELGVKAIFKFFNDFSRFKITKIDDMYVINSFYPPFPSESFDRALYTLNHSEDCLLFAHVSITNKCNYDCQFCSNKHKQGGEMSLREVKNVIRRLKEKNIFMVGFTGGEPMLREDLPEIIKSVGRECVSYIYTSGCGFNEGRAKDLKDAGLFGVAVSFDSYIKEEHDLSRGFEGAFENALNAVKISKRFGFYTIAQIIIGKNNINSVFEFLRFLKGIEVDEVRILEAYPCGGFIGNDKLILDEDERDFIRNVGFTANERFDLPKVVSYNLIESGKCFGCFGGYNFVYVDANGELCPCDMTPLSFGNILEEDFESVWKRMKEVFSKPNRECFALKYADEIKVRFKGRLPLGYEDSKEICRNYCPEEYPDYYMMMKNFHLG